MPGLIKVAAVSFRPEIKSMLHRYVGGILKEIATVQALTPEEALETQCDLYVVYTQGMVYSQLSKKISLEHLIPVELFPLPVGMKRVLSLPEGHRLGILAGHLWDAADFLHQLIMIGARNYCFTTGTPETIMTMEVDRFIVPEEIAPYILDPIASKKMVIVPRTLDPQSVARIIQVALKIQKSRE